MPLMMRMVLTWFAPAQIPIPDTLSDTMAAQFLVNPVSPPRRPPTSWLSLSRPSVQAAGMTCNPGTWWLPSAQGLLA